MDKQWHEAVRMGNVQALRDRVQFVLLSKKGSADATTDESLARTGISSLINSKDQYGQTGLMLAALHGHLDVARYLIEAGAELNHTAKYNLSALMLAVINRHANIARMLIEAGADPSIQGRGAPGFFQLTVRDLAKNNGLDEIVALLDGQGQKDTM